MHFSMLYQLKKNFAGGPDVAQAWPRVSQLDLQNYLFVRRLTSDCQEIFREQPKLY